METMLTVSFNGADNMGKTTHIRLLPYRPETWLAEPLHKYSDRLRKLADDGRLRSWWWSCSIQDFVSTHFLALKTRYECAKENDSADLAIFDRGVDMFHAVSTVMIAMKMGDNNLEVARPSLRSLLQELDLDVPTEDVKILFKFSSTVSEGLECGLARERAPIDERYRLYQGLLHRELEFLEGEKRFNHVCIENANSNMMEVQDRVRKIVSQHASRVAYVPFHVPRRTIIAIGGLSECGKSTIAARIVGRQGGKRYRMKIGYFMEEAKMKTGLDVYAQEEGEQALLLLREVDHFLRAHHWMEILTLESVHRFKSIQWLKRWLGKSLLIVFVKTSQEIRSMRCAGSLKDMARKDVEKRARGAQDVEMIADLVLNNDGDLEDTMKELDTFIDDVRSASTQPQAV